MATVNGALGYEIYLPNCTSSQSLQICVKHSTNTHYSGTLQILENAPTVTNWRTQVHEFTIETGVYYLVHVKGKCLDLAVSPYVVLKVHEVDEETKAFEKCGFVASSAVNIPHSSGRYKISEWRGRHGSHHTFVIYSTSSCEQNAVAIRFQSDEDSEPCTCVSIGTPSSDYVATKKELSQDRKSALLELKPDLSTLEITHIASIANVDYPTFQPIVQEAAKESKFLLVSESINFPFDD
jgi:hypothetical protein